MFKFNSFVVAKLPRAGLGNKLFIWAEAFLFASENRLPLVIRGLNTISIGPLLRGEKIKRVYWGQFRSNRWTTLAVYLLWGVFLRRRSGQSQTATSGFRYVFDQMPHWSNYFGKFKHKRPLVIDGFMSLLSSNSNELFVKEKPPLIACHIRMGDFKMLSKGVDFKTVGGTRTPLEYFISCISQIRTLANECLPVTIFSDGYQQELKEILELEKVYMHNPVSEAVDMLLMSKSRLIVTSAASTFGYWSGFLSDAILIRHPDHFHSSIRDDETNKRYYEGVLNLQDERLTEQLKKLTETPGRLC